MSAARLLCDTLELTLARDDAFLARFYDRLFASHPTLRGLFHRHSPGALHNRGVSRPGLLRRA